MSRRHRSGESSSGKKKSRHSSDCNPNDEFQCEGETPGCGSFNASNIFQKWPQLEHLPWPEPHHHSLAHRRWAKEYPLWRNLKCGQGHGYFCRQHAIWISCSEIKYGQAPSRDNEGILPCPNSHSTRDNALAEFADAQREGRIVLLSSVEESFEPGPAGDQEVEGISGQLGGFNLGEDRLLSEDSPGDFSYPSSSYTQQQTWDPDENASDYSCSTAAPPPGESSHRDRKKGTTKRSKEKAKARENPVSRARTSSSRLETREHDGPTQPFYEVRESQWQDDGRQYHGTTPYSSSAPHEQMASLSQQHDNLVMGYDQTAYQTHSYSSSARHERTPPLSQQPDNLGTVYDEPTYQTPDSYPSPYPTSSYPAPSYPDSSYPSSSYPASSYPDSSYPASSYLGPVDHEEDSSQMDAYQDTEDHDYDPRQETHLPRDKRDDSRHPRKPHRSHKDRDRRRH